MQEICPEQPHDEASTLHKYQTIRCKNHLERSTAPSSQYKSDGVHPFYHKTFNPHHILIVQACFNVLTYLKLTKYFNSKMKSLFITLAVISLPLSVHGAHQITSDWMPENTFTQGVEGPAVDKNGYLYAVNFVKSGTIARVSDKNKASIFLKLPNGSVGNGIRFDHDDNMFIADYINHNILKYSFASKRLDVYAHNDKMNQPNDIAIMDNGILFASDPNWANNTGNLWRINNDGTTTLLEENMGTTNGVEVSPDNKTLYVNESVQRKVWQYELDEKGQVYNKRLFIQFDDHGLDGMRTDSLGQLYIARYGAGVVVVISPAGELVKTIKLKGQYPTNIAFGGEGGKQLFVTMQKRGAIETLVNDIPGRNYNKLK